jgi:hypothetical protein
MSLILRNGKFYDGDKEVPPEFGNKEQIKIIREQERLVEDLKGEGLEIEIEAEEKWTLSAHFKCICGKTLFMEDDNCDDVVDINGLLIDRRCVHCKRIYTINAGDPGELIVKLKS